MKQIAQYMNFEKNPYDDSIYRKGALFFVITVNYYSIIQCGRIFNVFGYYIFFLQNLSLENITKNYDITLHIERGFKIMHP